MRKQSNLGKFLKEKRVKSGLSQKQVSEKFGYKSPQFVSNWERGVSTPPIKTIKKLAEVYKVSVDEFFKILLQFTLDQTTEEFKRKFYGKKGAS